MFTINQKLSILVISLLMSLPGYSFDQCELVLNQAKAQTDNASSQLQIGIERFEAAEVYNEEGSTALALNSINSSEVSLYNARGYYVMALFRLNHAETFCSGPATVEISEMTSKLKLKLDVLDVVEEEVYVLKNVILSGGL